ncbi:MAG: L,D-transpeptidase [Planctomycetota bacterium]|jgi:hypothetical protein
MARRKKSHLPTVGIGIALAAAAYFALFGSNAVDEPPPAIASEAPEPAPRPEPVQAPEEIAEPEPLPEVQVIEIQEELEPDPQQEQWNLLQDLCRQEKWRETRPVIAGLFASDLTSDDERATLADTAIRINQNLLVMKPDKRDVIIHEVKGGQVLTTIGRKYKQFHGAWGLIAITNHIEIADAGRLRAGKKLRIPKGGWSIFADKSMYRMWLLYEGTPFKEYDIAIGKENKTPTTVFKVHSKTPKPTWYPPPSAGIKDAIIPYGDPRNPLGDYWIQLEHAVYDGFGVHGTNDEEVIGTQITNGCLRMHNKEVVEMAMAVYKGMTLTIVE